MATWLERYRNVIVIGLAALLAGGIVYLVIDRGGGPQPLEMQVAGATPSPGGPIQVFITGAVVRPGVYEMRDGDRVIDLLNEAGGFAPDADPEALALAERLQDEATVVVPRLSEPTREVVGVVTAHVDINKATAEDLIALPGIGEVYSGRIIESRTTDGPFVTTDELVERGLIPRSTYERIRNLITVGP